MRLLCQHEGTLYVACGEVLIAFNLNKTGELNQFEFPAGKGSQIVAVTVSNDGKYVFAGYANKYLCCWDTQSKEVLGSALHSKRPTAIVYMEVNTDQRCLVVSDKAGLIHGTDVPNFKKNVLLAGHTASVITDMATDGKYIATSDRDEKVRISNFPRMEIIESFCMAHTNVVTSITFALRGSDLLLVSCGWDHRLCLWNKETGKIYDVLQYETGVETAAAGAAVGAVLDSETTEEKNDSTTIATEAVTDAVDADMDIEACAPEDVAEKTYDENSAGHYPVKVVASPTSSMIAVIFKSHLYVKIYNIKKSESGQYSFYNKVTKDLSAAPCDVCFTNSNELVVLLPKPFYMQVFSIDELSNNASADSSTINVKDFNDTLSVVTSFQKSCSDQGFDFSQQLVSTEDGGDAEKGIRKHALDRPFTKSTGIDPEKKKGSKRSRRRAGFEKKDGDEEGEKGEEKEGEGEKDGEGEKEEVEDAEI